MTVVTMVEPTERVHSEGTPVEVRNRFDARWNRGFGGVDKGGRLEHRRA